MTFDVKNVSAGKKKVKGVFGLRFDTYLDCFKRQVLFKDDHDILFLKINFDSKIVVKVVLGLYAENSN